MYVTEREGREMENQMLKLSVEQLRQTPHAGKPWSITWKSPTQASWWNKHTKGDNLGAVCILCYSYNFTLAWESQPRAHLRQTPLTQWDWMVNMRQASPHPHPPFSEEMKPTSDAFKSRSTSQAPEMTTMLCYVMVPSRGNNKDNAGSTTFSVVCCSHCGHWRQQH